MPKTIPLQARSDYGLSGQYIARITGRDDKFTFKRHFLGRKSGKRNELTEELIDMPGLYEECNVDKKKGKVSTFYAVLRTGDTLNAPALTKPEAMEVAKRLDTGEDIHDIVAYDLSLPSGQRHSIRSKAQAARAAEAFTVEQAKKACWDVLQKLDTKSAKKVLSELKLLVAPPPPAAAPESAPEPAPEPAAQPDAEQPCLQSAAI